MTGPTPLNSGEPSLLGGAITLVEGSTFCLSDRVGDVEPGTAQGLFYRDARVLSRWELRVDGQRPEPLSVLSPEAFTARFIARRGGPAGGGGGGGEGTPPPGRGGPPPRPGGARAAGPKKRGGWGGGRHLCGGGPSGAGVCTPPRGAPGGGAAGGSSRPISLRRSCGVEVISTMIRIIRAPVHPFSIFAARDVIFPAQPTDR